MDVYKELETAIKQRAFRNEADSTRAAQLLQQSGKINQDQVQKLIGVAIDSYLMEGSNYSHKPYKLDSAESILEFLQTLK